MNAHAQQLAALESAADGGRAQAGHSAARDAATLALLYGLAAAVSIAVSRQPGSIAAIWFANALAVGFLVTAPGSRWLGLLAATAAANLAANLGHGSPLPVALALLAGNVAEVLVAAWLVARWGTVAQGLRSPLALLRLLVLGALLPQAVGATLAAWTLPEPAGLTAGVAAGSAGLFWQTWLNWYVGSAIGSISMLALVVGLRQARWPQLRAELLDWRFWALGAAASGVALLSLAKLPFPFVYISIPLLLAAIAIGMNATLALVLLVSFVMALGLGAGVFVPPPITAQWEEVFVYAAYAAALVPAQLLAAAMAEMRDGQQRLAEATAELQRANAGLEQFVHIASHDMREPLNTIVQFSALIEQDHGAQLPPDARRWLGLVVGAGTRMRRLLDDVLVYVRLQRDGTATASAPVDLQQVLHDVVEALAGSVQASQAQVTVGALPVVAGHEVPLSLLFQNLVSNAIKFMPAGRTPVVGITARQHGGLAHIEVADNGIGIAPEDVPKLFKPFQRLHLRRQYDGTGLGLALVRQIAEAHGGSVALESSPGAGTRVTVCLPLWAGHEADSER